MENNKMPILSEVTRLQEELKQMKAAFQSQLYRMEEKLNNVLKPEGITAQVFDMRPEPPGEGAIKVSSGNLIPSTSFIASPTALGTSFPDYRKNVLHQITNELIARYDPLDTAQVSRSVLAKLNTGCVTQRLFGEVVLGLSQGAVSDLLKRPKPWINLTRATKEHYVRMQQFLEDDKSIPVLRSIQIRVHPDRLLVQPETNLLQLSGNSMIPSTSIAVTPIKRPTPPMDVLNGLDPDNQEIVQAVKSYFEKFYKDLDASVWGVADTVVVSSQIQKELRSRNLEHWLIEELVLNVDRGYFDELLKDLTPFMMLSPNRKEHVLKLRKLIQTPDDFKILEAYQCHGLSIFKKSKNDI